MLTTCIVGAVVGSAGGDLTLRNTLALIVRPLGLSGVAARSTRSRMATWVNGPADSSEYNRGGVAVRAGEVADGRWIGMLQGCKHTKIRARKHVGS